MEKETTKELRHRIELMEKEMEILKLKLKLKLELAEKQISITYVPAYPCYPYPKHLVDYDKLPTYIGTGSAWPYESNDCNCYNTELN